MLNTEKILKKYRSEGALQELQAQLSKRNYIFGNAISIARRNLYNAIEYILYNEDNFIECEYCQEKFTPALMQVINGENICEDCIANNFTNCEACEDYVYNEDIHIIDEAGYCKKCYFIEKQKLYNAHIIKNPLLIKLQGIFDNCAISDIEFKIEKNYFSIEKYSGKYYRLGSFGANAWIDIGENIEDLIKAIDFNLGARRDLLTAININDKAI